MKLIVGLGNAGPEYAKTRHNVGFMALDYFIHANKWPAFKEVAARQAEIAEQTTQEHKILLAKPQTMMNASGVALQNLMHFYKIPPADVLVVYDELDLPFGSVRVRTGGGTAGHRGVESVTEHVSDAFLRVRIGIANKVRDKKEAADFVLDRFSKAEEEQLPYIFDYTNHLIHEFINGAKLSAHTEKCLPNLIT